MDAAGRRDLIEGLCSFEGRWPGTDAERRAANWLAGKVKGMGRRAEIEPIYVNPEYSLAMAAHLLLAIAGSLVALISAPIGFVIVLFAATSLYLDQNTRLYLLRRLLFRRASQHVVSRGRRPDAPVRLILTAHYDVSKSGFVFGPRSTRAARRLSERARILLGPIRLIFWAGIVPLLLISGLRMAGIDGAAIGAIQLLPTFVLLISIVALVDIALSKPVPGAYDNASGVAAVLSVATALDADPPENLDVWVILAGAEESNAQGMARYVAAHRKEMDRERTIFLNVDSVSYGRPHYMLSEGAIVSYWMDRRLIELSEAVAAAEPAYEARPIRIPFHSDALPARTRGFRAISILGCEDGVNPPYYHTHDDTPDKLDEEAMTRSVEFVIDLTRAIDADAGRSHGKAAPVAEAV